MMMTRKANVHNGVVYVNIDKNLIDIMGIKKGDYLEVDIKQVLKHSKK